MESLGHLEKVIENYHKALSIKSGFAGVYANLAVALKSQGRVQEAIEKTCKLLQIKPGHASARSNLLFYLNYNPDYDAGSTFAEHKRYGERYAQVAVVYTSHPNLPDPDRRLKIGYVSPDLQAHSVAYFIESILTNHSPAMIETFCYAEVVAPDAITERLRQLAAHWRTTCGETDAQLAEMIRTDEIDILVDLAGHTAKNRLPTFALKPAPVQITYLGYPNTTGLTTMDYRLTDELADPPGARSVSHGGTCKVAARVPLLHPFDRVS